ncbi:MAG: ChbG/HpnK family deacetylase, partial [Deltaproteobacteria bacterium]|nr:ChbG/HpnK family deacetylase [Deltaproteobacteria bacterium]
MTILEALGFSKDQRVTILHVDDMGLCEAANRGAFEALAGAASCGSIMVPCPGFEALVRDLEQHPEAPDGSDWDLGIHLTLNGDSRGPSWGPVSANASSLINADGKLWPTNGEVVTHAALEEVEEELRAQIDKALAAGIDVTHLDSHMGTLFDLKFVDLYLRLAVDYRLPVFVPRIKREHLASHDLPDELERYLEIIEKAEALGFPVFDGFEENSLSFAPGTGLEHNRARLQGLAPGLSYYITHCARA